MTTPESRWETEALREKGLCGKIEGEPPNERACLLLLDHEGPCGRVPGARTPDDQTRLTEADLQHLELHGATTLDFNRMANEVRACWRERAKHEELQLRWLRIAVLVAEGRS